MEVGEGDGVHVSDGKLPARPRCQPHHGKVFQQLTADGTGSNLPGHGRCSSPAHPGTPPAAPQPLPAPRRLPQLTTKYFWRPSCSWKAAPKTAIWPS